MKIRAIFWLILCAAIIWAGCTSKDVETVSGPVYTGTQIEGEITEDITAAQSPYWVTGDITIPAGATVRIEPGVELRFDGLHKFLVQGHLDAVGTAEENIVFTSMEGALGSGDFGQWRAILFDTGDDVSEMAFCTVQFGAVWDSTERYPVYPEGSDSVGMWLNGAVITWNCSPFIRNCTILANGYHGIYCIGDGSDPYILNNNIYENDGDGIRWELGAAAEVWYNNSFENNARQFATEAVPELGVMSQLNANRDSCDFQYNIRKDPRFIDFEVQDYTLHSCSALIGAGKDTLDSNGHIGSIPYYLGATELRGPIGGTVITAAASPWTVSCNAFIEPGETLIAEPGAVVLFDDIYYLRIAGLLQAEGVTFMPADTIDAGAKWEGIIMTADADPNSYIRDCVFDKASTTMKEEPYGGAITLQGVSPEISGNTFLDCEHSAISCQNGAAPEITWNVIDGFGEVAINCYNNSHPKIEHNIIRNGSGYGILCQKFSSPSVKTNLIYSTQSVGIKCVNNAAPSIQYNTIAGHDYTGLKIDDHSNPSVINNIIAFNGSPECWSVSGWGCGINVSGSSVPTISYNDVYQPANQGIATAGITLDETNISLDPLFEEMEAGNFHLQSGSPCENAGSDGGEIGAYGLGDW